MNFIVTLVLAFKTVASLKINGDLCLSNSQHSKKYGVSFTSCARDCFLFDECKLLSYRRSVHSCAMYSKMPATNVYGCYGNVVVYKDDLNRTDPCTACSNSTTNYCQDDFKGDEDSIVLGNMNKFGTKRLLMCKPTFKMIGNMTTICQINGTWSEVGTCNKICSKPTPGKHMSFTNVYTLDESEKPYQTTWDTADAKMLNSTIITIDCANETQHLGPVNITCIAGRWTDFPECKLSTMRKSCKSNQNCTDEKSECRLNTCWCQPGLSYDASNLSCVSRCPGQYGTTFQLVEGYVIKLRNMFKEYNLTSALQCGDFCLNADDDDYMCTSAEFFQTVPSDKPWFSACNLNEEVEEIILKAESRATFLQRDCA